MTNFQFVDANGNKQTAGASSVGGALYTQIQIVDSTSSNTANINSGGALLITGSVVTVTSPTSVSGVGIFNVNIASGSIVSVATPTSVSGVGTFNVNVIQGSIVGVNNPSSVSGVGTFNVNVIQGSVVSVNQPGSVSGVGIFNINPTGNGSILTIIPGSVATVSSPASVSGVGLFNINPVGNGSVLALIQGSVIAVIQNSSFLSVPVGSTIAVLQAPSIVGTYAQTSIAGAVDKGLFSLGVRNDTMSSIMGTDKAYSAQAVGPIGERITANAPITKWTNNQGSVFSATSVQIVAPAGAGISNYVSAVQIANASATYSLIKITTGLGSVIGWASAPANGGSNINFINPISTGPNAGVSASISGVSSIYVTIQGFISNT